MKHCFGNIFYTFICLVCCIVFAESEALCQNYFFETISTREGLSQNDINSIYQDSNGFLWIGTHDGLNRYDGYEFKTYRHDPLKKDGIPSSIILEIEEDSYGNLWVGTSVEGVYILDVKTDKIKTLKNTSDNPNSLSSNKIIKILPLRDGEVWIGTSNGIDVVTPKRDDYEIKKIALDEYPEIKSFTITDIEEDIYGRKWVGTSKGVYVFVEKAEETEVIVVDEYSYVRDILISNGEIFIANHNTVSKIRMNFEDLSELKIDNVCQVYADRILKDHDDILMATPSGLYISEKIQGNANEYTIPRLFDKKWHSECLSTKITSLLKDKSGNIWIGTNGGGLHKFYKNRKAFRHYNKTNSEGSISYNKVRAIYEDSEKNIWIGTEEGGVNFFAHNKNKNYNSGFIHLDMNKFGIHKSAFTFAEFESDDEKYVIAGTSYPEFIQLLKLKDNGFEVADRGILSEINSLPNSMIKDHAGNIWIGTFGQGDLFKYVKTKNEEQIYNYAVNPDNEELKPNTIRSLMQDTYGNIWIGTDNGLNLLTPEEQNKMTPHFHVFRNEPDNPNTISNNYILPIFQSGDGTIWVGTFGGGLNKMKYHSNPDSISFETVTTYDGLPNNVIKGILEDEYGYLWISSNRGLSRFDVENHLIFNYDIYDGLQDYEFSEFSCCRLTDGEMIFGGVNGFNAFYPKDIIHDLTLPIVALTDFQVLNNSVSPGEEINGRVLLENSINHTDHIRLKYSENSFAIYFTSLHFAAPKKNKFKYTLEGFEKDWIYKDSEDRIAKYTNLRPGDYTFKVYASNNDGVWTDDPKVLHITIIPPWYFNNVALVIYFIIFIFLLWIFRRYSIIRVQHKNELIMKRFEAEKEQELSHLKLQFFTNISHEFRTPLALILGPLEKLMQKGDSLSSQKASDLFSMMHRNVSILDRLINQLIEFRKLEQGKVKLYATNSNIVPFIDEIFQSFKDLAEKKKISYSFTSKNENINVWFDNEKVERIMYNLLSNAFKYTNENGEIRIGIEDNDKDVVIKVIDDGIGIPKSMHKHIFERFFQNNQIKTRKVGGAGIGLSYIKGLVEMHKGTISFDSDEGEGSTFIVTLKKGEKHLSNDQMLEASSVPDTEIQVIDIPEHSTKALGEIKNEDKPSVLVVEDNYELRNFLKESLSENYNVYLAEDGKSGLKITHECSPDIIVSDVMMPEMDGFELCDAIKNDENISHTPIILLTAKTDADSRVKGYNTGADGYISKPFNIGVLEARMLNLIESREKLKAKLQTTITVEPSEVTSTSMDEKFLIRVLRIIEANISRSEFTVEQLAEEYGMSQVVFHKKIKVLTGQSPKVFIRSIRLKRAAQLLATGKYSVTDICYEVGFIDVKYFRLCFKKEFGTVPSQYSKQNTQQE